MNAIFEESFTTKEEPVENKEEYLANLLRTRRQYDLLANVLPQSYDVEESATNSGEFSWRTKKTPKIGEYRR